MKELCLKISEHSQENTCEYFEIVKVRNLVYGYAKTCEVTVGQLKI